MGATESEGEFRHFCIRSSSTRSTWGERTYQMLFIFFYRKKYSITVPEASVLGYYVTSICQTHHLPTMNCTNLQFWRQSFIEHLTRLWLAKSRSKHTRAMESKSTEHKKQNSNRTTIISMFWDTMKSQLSTDWSLHSFAHQRPKCTHCKNSTFLLCW